MADSEIQMLDWKCYMDYGHPSGHSFSCPLLSYFIYNLVFEIKGIRKES